MKFLSSELRDFSTFLGSIPTDKLDFSYEKDKWTIKEVIGHVIEIERVFAYRILTISRGDDTKLPSVNQEKWMDNNLHKKRSLQNLTEEFITVRTSTLQLLENMDSEMIGCNGFIGNTKISVRALAFLVAGHQLHHQKIIEEKYLAI